MAKSDLVFASLDQMNAAVVLLAMSDVVIVIYIEPEIIISLLLDY